MGALNLTIQVQNVDPTVTTAELETFFFYCGNVDKIQLQRQGKNLHTIDRLFEFLPRIDHILFWIIRMVRLISYDDGTGIKMGPNRRR